MAITLLFEPNPGADTKYDNVLNALKAKGIWPPDGLTYHLAFGSGAQFKVLEVWESEQHARKFGESLMPILRQHGIELSSEPRPLPVKNIVQGKSQI